MIAIDLGSNTIRFLEFDCDKRKKTFIFEKVVKTANSLEEKGLISDSSVSNIIETIEEVKERIDFSQPIKAAATYAFRVAKNAQDVIEKIHTKTGVEFEVLSEDEESFYTAKAVKEYLGTNRSFFLVDIGGGSTEMVISYKEKMISQSYPLGIVTLTDRYVGIESLKRGIKSETKVFEGFFKDLFLTFKPERFIANSGVPTTVAALKQNLTYRTYTPEKVNGTTITIEDLDEWMATLLKLTIEEREKLIGSGRGDIIIGGIALLKQIFVYSGFDRCLVCDESVREGIAYTYCEELSSKIDE